MDLDDVRTYLFPKHAPWRVFPAVIVALSLVGVVWGVAACGVGVPGGDCDSTSVAFLVLSIITSVVHAVFAILFARRFFRRAAKRSTHLHKLALDSPLSTMTGQYTVLWCLLVVGWLVTWIIVSMIVSRAEPMNGCKDQLRYLTSFYLVEVGVAVVLFLMTWVSEGCQKPNWKREAELEYCNRTAITNEMEGKNRVLEREMANDPRYPQSRGSRARPADVGDADPLDHSGQKFDDIGDGGPKRVRQRSATENTDARIAEMARRSAQYQGVVTSSMTTPSAGPPPGAAVPPSGASIRTLYDSVHPYSPVGSSVVTRRAEDDSIMFTPRENAGNGGGGGQRGVQFAKANPVRDALNEAMKSKGHAAIAQRTLNHRMHENSMRGDVQGEGDGGRRLTYDGDAPIPQGSFSGSTVGLQPEMSMNEAGYYLDLLGITNQSHRSLTGTESGRSDEDLNHRSN